MISNNKDQKAGFTIVELMVAMLATTIFALVVGGLMVYTWMGWSRYKESVQMQRDTSVAMRIMEREIRRTPIENITPGTSLMCVNTNGTFVFTQDSGNLNMTKNNDPALALVQNYVTSFSATTNANGSVRVVLNLSTGSDTSQSSMRVYSRN